MNTIWKLNIVMGTMAVLLLIYCAVDAAHSDTGVGYIHLGMLWLSGVLSAVVAGIVISK